MNQLIKCLIRKEIQNTIFIPRYNDDMTLDVDSLERTQTPKGVIEQWQRMLADSYDAETLNESAMLGLFSTNIDDDINKFLCDNKISKEDLHSIERVQKQSILEQYSRAIIIYEGEKIA